MLFRRIGWACLTAFVTVSSELISQPGWANDRHSPVQQRIEQLRQEHGIPGASVAVIEDGTIVWAKGFGVADLASGRPVTTDTLFQAQSITKTLTALATVKLLAAKQIALDEPVNRYLKSWVIPENDYSTKVPVSFRMLLNHTGALSNPYPDGCCGPTETLPTLQQVLRGRLGQQPTVTVERPRRFDYCNGCYRCCSQHWNQSANNPSRSHAGVGAHTSHESQHLQQQFFSEQQKHNCDPLRR